MTIFQRLSRHEFAGRVLRDLLATYQGGPPFSLICAPLADGRTRLVICIEGCAYYHTLDGERPPEFDVTWICSVDQDKALVIIAELTDYLLADAATRPTPTREERRALKSLWHDVPCSLNWCAMPDGRHLIWARNAGYKPIWQSGEWRELAAHPSEYGDIWQVSDDQPRSGFGRGSLCFGYTPSLKRWAEFEATNARLWHERTARDAITTTMRSLWGDRFDADSEEAKRGVKTMVEIWRAERTKLRSIMPTQLADFVLGIKLQNICNMLEAGRHAESSSATQQSRPVS